MKRKIQPLRNSAVSSETDEGGISREKLLSGSIDVLAALSVGGLAALGIWLWQTNVDGVVIAAILNGLANCF